MNTSKLYLVIFLIFFISCNESKNCKNSDFLIGRYRIDTTLVSDYNNNDNTILPLLKEKQWDSIILVVEKNNYFFEKSPIYFKNYEGVWEYKSIGFDGDCYVYIRQNMEARNLPLDPFSISIRFEGKQIILPFRK